MIRSRWFSLAVLLPLLMGRAPLVFFGAGTAAGVAGYKYYKGALIVVYEAPCADTWEASLTALENMMINVDRSSHDLTQGKISGTRSDKKPVSISLEYKSAQKTEVEIRVGILGDKEISMAIKEEIRKSIVKK